MKKTQAESHFTLHLHLIQYTCHQTVLVILMTSPKALSHLLLWAPLSSTQLNFLNKYK